MTLDMARVAELFSLFADLEGQDLRPWHSFCSAAAGALMARLRNGVGKEAMEELCIAAAGIAYCDYLMLRQGAGQQDQIKVGDISLSASGGSAAIDSQELRSHFLANVTHLLEPEYAALIAVGDPL